MNRLENNDLDKLWSDIKPLLLSYVNLDREEPFTEGDLFVGLLSLSTQIIHRVEMSNLPNVLDSVKLEHGDIDTESIAFIIKDGVDEKDLEKVLYELLTFYHNQFATFANQVLHSVLEAIRD